LTAVTAPCTTLLSGFVKETVSPDMNPVPVIVTGCAAALCTTWATPVIAGGPVTMNTNASEAAEPGFATTTFQPPGVFRIASASMRVGVTETIPAPPIG